MRILVTGGAGYIGSMLVPQLLRNYYYVTVLDSLLYGSGSLSSLYGDSRLRFVKGSICDKTLVKDTLKGVSAVIHLAALRMNDCPGQIEQVGKVNVEGTRHLFEAAVETGAKCFIFASSCSIYGAIPTTKIATEKTSPNLISPYAKSKIAAENIILKMLSDDTRTVVLRFASAYGLSANMRFDLLLNGLALDAVMKSHLNIWGAETCRALAHVRDLVAAIMQSIESKNWHGVINVGGHNRSKRELAGSLVSQIPDLTVEYHDAPLPPDTRDYKVNFNKIRALGFFPSFIPEYGLSEIVKSLQLGIVRDQRRGNNESATG